MDYTTIQFHPGPRVASIVLDRPPLNVITIQMIDELNAALDEVGEIQSQVVVFSGQGERAFSAGVDVRDHAPERAPSMLESFHRVIRRIRDADFVALAAIHGHTLGGGAELALACDLIIAGDDLSFGFPEIDVGCYPPAAAALLPAAIGWRKASELVLLGKPVGAAEAKSMGLVNTVVARERLNDAVDRCVDDLLGKSAAVLRLAKRALREGARGAFEEALERTERIYVDDLMRLEDAGEGLKAFIEKRPPEWRNR